MSPSILMPIQYETLSIRVGREKIAGTFVTKQTEQAPAILFVHGWGANQEHDAGYAAAAADLGFACMIFDLRGHGVSDGRHEAVSRQQNLQDVVAAYDALASRSEVDISKLAIAGTSYGGYLAAVATQLRPVCCLALRAPAIYRDIDWLEPKLSLHRDPELLVYRSRVVLWDDNRALQACAAFLGEALIVQSEHDDIVPAAVIESYTRAFTHARSVTRRLIAGADHGLSEERYRYEYQSILLSWLGEIIFKPAGEDRR